MLLLVVNLVVEVLIERVVENWLSFISPLGDSLSSFDSGLGAYDDPRATF
jgi:hypothetical protein